MTTGAVEMHYSIQELGLMYRFAESTIREFIKRGEFGPLEEDVAREQNLGPVLNVNGKDIRVPASRCHFFQNHHQLNQSLGIKARNNNELQRKLKQAA